MSEVGLPKAAKQVYYRTINLRFAWRLLCWSAERLIRQPGLSHVQKAAIVPSHTLHNHGNLASDWQLQSSYFLRYLKPSLWLCFQRNAGTRKEPHTCKSPRVSSCQFSLVVSLFYFWVPTFFTYQPLYSIS